MKFLDMMMLEIRILGKIGSSNSNWFQCLRWTERRKMKWYIMSSSGSMSLNHIQKRKMMHTIAMKTLSLFEDFIGDICHYSGQEERTICVCYGHLHLNILSFNIHSFFCIYIDFSFIYIFINLLLSNMNFAVYFFGKILMLKYSLRKEKGSRDHFK